MGYQLLFGIYVHIPNVGFEPHSQSLIPQPHTKQALNLLENLELLLLLFLVVANPRRGGGGRYFEFSKEKWQVHGYDVSMDMDTTYLLRRIALDGDDDVLDVLSFGAKDIEGLRSSILGLNLEGG
ncbi:hypothetical protein Tco_1044850 [Tanacetum coccineum]|uniref:Uncharacterized protein n=1 Tax=Tanacetum coccineum TaxID=301880 RepID=A0ABQ5GR41_9ASTR